MRFWWQQSGSNVGSTHSNRPTPITLRSTSSIEVEDVSAALTVAEYNSIRAESLQSFTTSQSIIQWSLATYGVLFGAGLLAASNQIADQLAGAVFWMAALIYGILLPGLVCAAAWSWIGEIRRMERTGVYLRGVERRLREQTSNGSASVINPLNWETFLSGSLRPKGTPVKGWAPYLGTSMLFGGGIISSVVFFYFWTDRLLSIEGPSLGIRVLIAVDSILYLGFIVVCIHVGLGVVSLGGQQLNLVNGQLEPNGRTNKAMVGVKRLAEPIILTFVFVLSAAFAYCLLPRTILELILSDDLLTARDQIVAWIVSLF